MARVILEAWEVHAVTHEAADKAKQHNSSVTAIDIALEPDQTMIGHAREANATLRASFPAGFPLDATHHPHVSIFAGFVPTADLPKVYAVASEVLAREQYTAWELTAFKYYYIPLVRSGWPASSLSRQMTSFVYNKNSSTQPVTSQ